MSAAGAEEDARPEVQVRSSGTSFVKSVVAHTGFVNPFRVHGVGVGDLVEPHVSAGASRQSCVQGDYRRAFVFCQTRAISKNWISLRRFFFEDKLVACVGFGAGDEPSES